MRVGYRRTFAFLIGMSCGFTVVMLACGLLNVALVNLLPTARFWLNLAGAAYLIYLAIHTALSKPPADQIEEIGMNTFLAGVTLQFLNLKLILYGVTVFSLFITTAFQNPLTVSLFAPALAGVGFVATSCWALGGTLFRNFWIKYYRAFNLVMAAFLIYSAAASIWGH